MTVTSRQPSGASERQQAPTARTVHSDTPDAAVNSVEAHTIRIICTVSPASGPAAHYPHNAGGRIPDRPSWRGFPLSLVWALAPLYTCGFATPFIIGHAAVRLKSRNLGFAAGVYGVLLIVYCTVAIAFTDNNPVTEEPAVNVAAGLWIFTGWLGGTVHAFILRTAVFRPRLVAHVPSAVWRHSPMPPPPYYAPAASPPSYQAHAAPPPSHQAHAAPAQAPPVSSSVSQLFARPPRNSMGAESVSHSFDKIGPYQPIRKIGEGGQGAVYLAHGPDGRQVAIKVLHNRIIGGEAERESFVREAAMAQRVRPFATARVIDIGVLDDLAYIVSEYVPGPSLQRLVGDEGPRGGDSLTRLAVGTAAALKGIHAAGIVHRDFKPANVLIGPDGPRVIDFGIARALDRVTMTSGGLKGTLFYMSPEQISGEPVGPESDIFSWGATMLFGATGRHAFAAGSQPVVFKMIINHHPDLSVLPVALQDPVAACLAKDPRDRPTAAEVMLRVTS
ncbi:serine/threonine-protein kinase [Streptosporangium canum]|uniref:serine/threonine-protein kinase n=1 Tax=Streptosporangium canum TaxID=324952 RepID=UPI0034232ED8